MEKATYCDTKEASEILGLDSRWIRKIAKEYPDFPAIRLGKKFFFIRDELEPWVRANKVQMDSLKPKKANEADDVQVGA